MAPKIRTKSEESLQIVPERFEKLIKSDVHQNQPISSMPVNQQQNFLVKKHSDSNSSQ